MCTIARANRQEGRAVHESSLVRRGDGDYIFGAASPHVIDENKSTSATHVEGCDKHVREIAPQKHARANSSSASLDTGTGVSLGSHWGRFSLIVK